MSFAVGPSTNSCFHLPLEDSVSASSDSSQQTPSLLNPSVDAKKLKVLIEHMSINADKAVIEDAFLELSKAVQNQILQFYEYKYACNPEFVLENFCLSPDKALSMKTFDGTPFFTRLSELLENLAKNEKDPDDQAFFIPNLYERLEKEFRQFLEAEESEREDFLAWILNIITPDPVLDCFTLIKNEGIPPHLMPFIGTKQIASSALTFQLSLRRAFPEFLSEALYKDPLKVFCRDTGMSFPRILMHLGISLSQHVYFGWRCPFSRGFVFHIFHTSEMPASLAVYEKLKNSFQTLKTHTVISPIASLEIRERGILLDTLSKMEALTEGSFLDLQNRHPFVKDFSYELCCCVQNVLHTEFETLPKVSQDWCENILFVSDQPQDPKEPSFKRLTEKATLKTKAPWEKFGCQRQWQLIAKCLPILQNNPDNFALRKLTLQFCSEAKPIDLELIGQICEYLDPDLFEASPLCTSKVEEEIISNYAKISLQAKTLQVEIEVFEKSSQIIMAQSLNDAAKIVHNKLTQKFNSELTETNASIEHYLTVVMTIIPGRLIEGIDKIINRVISRNPNNFTFSAIDYLDITHLKETLGKVEDFQDQLNSLNPVINNLHIHMQTLNLFHQYPIPFTLFLEYLDKPTKDIMEDFRDFDAPAFAVLIEGQTIHFSGPSYAPLVKNRRYQKKIIDVSRNSREGFYGSQSVESVLKFLYEKLALQHGAEEHPSNPLDFFLVIPALQRQIQVIAHFRDECIKKLKRLKISLIKKIARLEKPRNFSTHFQEIDLQKGDEELLEPPLSKEESFKRLREMGWGPSQSQKPAGPSTTPETGHSLFSISSLEKTKVNRKEKENLLYLANRALWDATSLFFSTEETSPHNFKSALIPQMLLSMSTFLEALFNAIFHDSNLELSHHLSSSYREIEDCEYSEELYTLLKKFENWIPCLRDPHKKNLYREIPFRSGVLKLAQNLPLSSEEVEELSNLYPQFARLLALLLQNSRVTEFGRRELQDCIKTLQGFKIPAESLMQEEMTVSSKTFESPRNFSPMSFLAGSSSSSDSPLGTDSPPLAIHSPILRESEENILALLRALEDDLYKSPYLIEDIRFCFRQIRFLDELEQNKEVYPNSICTRETFSRKKAYFIHVIIEHLVRHFSNCFVLQELEESHNAGEGSSSTPFTLANHNLEEMIGELKKCTPLNCSPNTSKVLAAHKTNMFHLLRYSFPTIQRANQVEDPLFTALRNRHGKPPGGKKGGKRGAAGKSLSKEARRKIQESQIERAMNDKELALLDLSRSLTEAYREIKSIIDTSNP